MKKEIKGFILGCITTAVIGSSVALADSISTQIEAVYNNIKIVVNGEQITPKDGNGNTVDPFIYNGTTYLPVRAVAEALNKKVDWNASDNSVLITDEKSDNIDVYVDHHAVIMGKDLGYTNINDIIVQNEKVYVSVDELAQNLNYRISHGESSVYISDSLYYSQHLYATVGDSSSVYPVVVYQPPEDNPNDSSNWKYYIDVNTLTNAGYSRQVYEDDDNFIWSYTIPSTSSGSKSNSSVTPKSDTNNNYDEQLEAAYESELDAINAKYDAMIEAVRSSYSGISSSVAVSAMAQQIQQYEQQRQAEIDRLNAKYGY